MEKTVEERLEHLEAQVHALIQLTLSHIVASGTADQSVAKDALEHAEIQRQAAIRLGKHRAALVLDDMISAVWQVLDLPAND